MFYLLFFFSSFFFFLSFLLLFFLFLSSSPFFFSLLFIFFNNDRWSLSSFSSFSPSFLYLFLFLLDLCFIFLSLCCLSHFSLYCFVCLNFHEHLLFFFLVFLFPSPAVCCFVSPFSFFSTHIFFVILLLTLLLSFSFFYLIFFSCHQCSFHHLSLPHLRFLSLALYPYFLFCFKPFLRPFTVSYFYLLIFFLFSLAFSFT